MSIISIRDGKKISITTFDFLKFSKQLTKRKLCGNFQKSQEKVVRFISVKLLSMFFDETHNYLKVFTRFVDQIWKRTDLILEVKNNFREVTFIFHCRVGHSEQAS